MNDEYDVNVNIRDDPAVDVQTDSAPDVNVNSDEEILIDAEVSPDIDIEAESDDEEQLDVSIDETLGGSVADHRRLSHRDEPKQHPISAIDGLSDRLVTIQNAIDTGFIDASAAISVVAVTASGKNTVFHASTAPTEQGTGQEFKVGDTWFNSSENYCMYTWNGTQWVREQFGNAAFAHASIWEANIQNGAITTAKINDAAITTAKIADAAITNAKIDSLDVSKLTGGYIDAQHIDASELVVDAAQITGTLQANQINLRQSLTIGSNAEFQMQLTGSAINLKYQTYLLGTITGSPAGDYIVLKSSSGDNVLNLGGGASGGVELSNGSQTINLSDMIYLGGNAAISGNLYVTSQTSATSTAKPNCHITTNGIFRYTSYDVSAKKYKNSISELSDPSLDPHKLYDIEVVQFKYNKDVVSDKNDQRYDTPVIGFIADQVADVYPVAVELKDAKKGNEVESWCDQYIIPPMLYLIQEQKHMIDELHERIEKIERRMA